VTRALFWDNDGVLVDTERIYFEATRDTMARLGVELTREQYYELFLVQAKGAWHLVRNGALTAEQTARHRAERDELYAWRLAQESAAVPGAEEVLQALHGRLPMGVVTSSRRRHFEIIHRRTGFLRYLDFAITIDECARCKPDPEPYRRAAERVGLPPGQCLAIEDSERGLAAAHAAGVPCWIIPTALTAHGDFGRAQAVLRSISEVPERLAARR
jgi:HAD superfamily hydrolase (TIGR01509 family)